MYEETVVAVFDTAVHADEAVRALKAADIPSSAISRQPSAGGTVSEPAPRETGFWSSLFGGEPDHDTSVYDRSISGGSHVVTVRVSEASAATVTAILDSHHPVDIDERAAGYGLPAAGTTTTAETLGATAALGARDTATRSGEQAIPLAEEQIQIGKRLVNRGTTRIRRFVVETPVEENVTLHSERVSIERRPAASGAQVADADFTDTIIEMTETDEEAVVGKTARVKEEVLIHKDATDRVETIHDTVRREDVEITKEGAAGTDRGRTGTVPPART